jgi:hypothetical protein
MQEIAGHRVSLADSQIDDSCWPLISNLVSLVRHVETSIAYCELAKHTHGQEDSDDDIAILDDDTPRYVTANRALIACDLQLREALHALLHANTTNNTSKITSKNAIVSLPGWQ